MEGDGGMEAGFSRLSRIFQNRRFATTLVGPMDFPVADRRGSGGDDRSGRILPRILFKSLIRAKRR